MDSPLVTLVWQRARGCCEYCQLPHGYLSNTHEIDRIIARKHRGPTVASNLALACFQCNNHKGTDLSGIDRPTRKLTSLFNPRRHKWKRHFRWLGAVLTGLTAIGRVTIDVLAINDPDRVRLRESLILEDEFPPKEV